jgi:hypothetical protein
MTAQKYFHKQPEKQIQVIQNEDKTAEMTTFQYLSSKSQIHAPGFEGQHSLHFFP